MLNIKINGFTGEAFIQPSPAGTPSQRPTWEVRTEEQPYAFLAQPEQNDGAPPTGRSMHINDNPAVGATPNRNKQHGFFFTADNCIGCHACEAACSEKNENPPHLAFRSVGYVEGGSWPDYQRMNISMACNHCDDPVCLKGCPTRAYTKHTEYGAVLQDPDTCFGCGYCTWVCPYNAPQLDPVKGEVSKCNMCVDRLEVGLKPACVAACVGNALDFGVIETVPIGREQARAEIPGFPSPDITRPNIRFQQKRELPDVMKRTDSMPIQYRRDERGRYAPAVDQKRGKAVHWNLARLASRENPLVLFTLAAQAAIGAFWLQFAGSLAGIDGFASFAASPMYAVLLGAEFALVAFGLFMSTMHLGKPKRFYRGFNNLRHSPVSREGLGIAAFIGALGAHAASSLVAPGSLVANLSGALAAVAGAAALYYMTRCYRIRARPFWNHWQVGTAFAGNALALGALLCAAAMLPALALAGESLRGVLLACAALVALGISIETVGHVAHARAMSRSSDEGGASYYVQSTTFGKTTMLRNALLGANLAFAASLLVLLAFGLVGERAAAFALLPIGAVLVATSVVGRALFYVLVIPTTMPGAFFWKNKGFEEHARQVGLARMPQVGVVPLGH